MAWYIRGMTYHTSILISEFLSRLPAMSDAELDLAIDDLEYELSGDDPQPETPIFLDLALDEFHFRSTP